MDVRQMKAYYLDRFIKAHERDYEKALLEVKAGRKKSHWMWYIFPQILGLGRSDTAVYYAVKDLGEARSYLENDVLGAHMTELCEALLKLSTSDAGKVFGFPDDMKLKSCMTLFELADPNQKLFGAVLDKFFEGKRCESTVKIVCVEK